MTGGLAIRKVLEMCGMGNLSTKNDETDTPPSNDGLVKLQSMRQQNRTFPEQSPKQPHPSHFKTAPARMSTEYTRNPSPIDTSSTTPHSGSPNRSPKRSPTVELEENKAYVPLGGPDYLKILAKYKLFGNDEHHGRVVCRFVNAGNIKDRQPQIIKVDEFSAQGNQEFLAHITIGNSNPPQSMFPAKQYLMYSSKS
jgi:hypothetical protein